MRLSQAALGLGRVDHVLISHLHGDHYFGLPGLLTSLALTGRTRPLTLVSPPGLRQRIAPLLDLDRYDLRFPLSFRELAAPSLTPVWRADDLEILAFPLRHRVPTNGYLIRETFRQPNMRKEAISLHDIPWEAIPKIKAGGDYAGPTGTVVPHAELTVPAPAPRSYGYCSDTAYFHELAEYVRGVDLLYHEATFLSDMAGEARDRGHSTAAEAARIAQAAGAGKLLMGHFSARYPRSDAHQREARKIFPAAFAVADLQRYVVPYPGREE